MGNGCYEVELEPEWIEKPMKLYIRVSGAGSYMDVVRNFVGVKVCAPSHFMTALQRRVQALQLLWQRRPPGSLPVTDDGVYAEVVKSGPFWPGVATEQALAIGAAEELPYRFDLFVE
jgi:predicted component of type VI protein secretion system